MSIPLVYVLLILYSSMSNAHGICSIIGFPGDDPVNIPANLCAGIPWQILNGPPGILTLVTREPDRRWDSCLRELQNRVCQSLSMDTHADTEWEVMPLERYNFLRDGEPVRVGRSWIAAPPDPLSSDTRTPNRHVASKGKIIFLRPGWAFGDGCHPSTQGSVNALEYLHEHHLVRDRDILDVGTGTGILGIIADCSGFGVLFWVCVRLGSSSPCVSGALRTIRGQYSPNASSRRKVP